MNTLSFTYRVNSHSGRVALESVLDATLQTEEKERLETRMFSHELQCLWTESATTVNTSLDGTAPRGPALMS